MILDFIGDFVMSKNYRIMFLRGSNNHPVGCLAMLVTNNQVKYQVSTLNPVDKFDRRVARQLALGRLIENPIEIGMNDTNIHNVVKCVMADIARNNLIPNRAKIAAKKWLSSPTSQIERV